MPVILCLLVWFTWFPRPTNSVSLQQKADAVSMSTERARSCAGPDEAHTMRHFDVNATVSSNSMDKFQSLHFYPSPTKTGGRSRSPITAQRQCWTSPLTADVSDPLEKRTLCPWTYRTNFERKRVPAVIFEAECQCDKFRLNGQTRHGHPTLTIEYECEPLMYRMRVMKFLDDDCREYRIAFEEIPVACVPVKQPSRLVNDRQTAIKQQIGDALPRDY